MKYNYSIYHKDGSYKEKGEGGLNDLERPIRADVLKLISSLEKENYNKHINLSLDTEDYTISLISIQEI